MVHCICEKLDFTCFSRYERKDVSNQKLKVTRKQVLVAFVAELAFWRTATLTPPPWKQCKPAEFLESAAV